MNIILYHANCMDGFGSAWAHWHLVGSLVPSNNKYIPMNYEEDIPYALMPDDNIVMLDYSMKKERVISLCKLVNTVTIIDHHKSAIEDLSSIENIPSNLTLYLSNENSGCVLAWDYYSSHTPPYFLQLIEDRDLWKFEEPQSKAFHAKASIMAREFDVWDDFLYIENVIEVCNAGAGILAFIQSTAESIAMNAEYTLVLDEPFIILNCNYQFVDDVGNILAKRHPNAYICMYFVLKNTVKYSLRSVGEIDCTKVAKLFGGGGHKNAAGFSLLLHESHFSHANSAFYSGLRTLRTASNEEVKEGD